MPISILSQFSTITKQLHAQFKTQKLNHTRLYHITKKVTLPYNNKEKVVK